MNAGDKFYVGTVTKRADFAEDLWMIRIRCEGDFKFLPGQYATLAVEVGEKRVQRPYSIASSPAEDELEFFIELVPEGALTPFLYQLKPGDQLLVRKLAKGNFGLDTSNGRKNHLLISTVTGVAPFVSYVRTLHREWQEGRFDGSHKLFLLNGASRPWEFGYREELNVFAKETPWFTYVPTVSRPWDHADWPGEIGRADDVLRKYADHWELDASNTMAYLCGHPDMIANSKAILRRRGFLDKHAIKEEVYWVPPRQVPVASQKTPPKPEGAV
ncbi:MAG TPA: ferredoxin--NADP reductase [Verrucomicrobiae bacterium]|nr:ferredoxin--NADP reductase [Verrucomicrobiae bacterium]